MEIVKQSSKTDKGNTITILDKTSYISPIEEILNDCTKYSNLDIPTGKEIISFC